MFTKLYVLIENNSIQADYTLLDLNKNNISSFRSSLTSVQGSEFLEKNSLISQIFAIGRNHQ